MTKDRPITAVFASEFWPGATARSLLPALRTRGWQIHELNLHDYFPRHPSVPGRIKARLLRQKRAVAFNKAILRAAQECGAEVFLTIKGTDITSETIRALQADGVMCTNYYPDYHFNDVGIDTIAAYDLIATTKSFQLGSLYDRAGRNRVEFVHHGYSDEFHQIVPTPPAGRDVDLLYVGNAGSAKIAFMSSLAEALPGVSIRIVGAGWTAAARSGALSKVEFLPVRHGIAYAEEVARARIIIAIHNGADPKTGFADLVSTRTFEIPACGGFMLHVDNDEVRSLFDVPTEIDTFTTVENCVARIRYWLANPEEREVVAARGHARAVPAYGYAARGRELAGMIEARLDG